MTTRYKKLNSFFKLTYDEPGFSSDKHNKYPWLKEWRKDSCEGKNFMLFTMKFTERQIKSLFGLLN